MEFRFQDSVGTLMVNYIFSFASEDSSQEDVDAEGTRLYVEIMQELTNQAQEKSFPESSGLNEAMERFRASILRKPSLHIYDAA